jgi:hypothetical protein
LEVHKEDSSIAARKALCAQKAARLRRQAVTGETDEQALAADVKAGDERVKAAVELRRAEARGFLRQAHGIETRPPQLVADLTLGAREAVPRQGTSRESRPQGRRTRSTASASRDGPLPQPEDPDLTPLQRGFLLLLDALVTTSSDGLETFLAFLELAATRVAAEIARLEKWGEQ